MTSRQPPIRPEERFRVQGKRYLDVNDYFAALYGRKIRKLAINLGTTCPNRDGSKGRGGCIFCSEAGSASRNAHAAQALAWQLQSGKDFLKKSYNKQAFLAYFQAFTPTYTTPEHLNEQLEQALSFPDIAGFAIASRADTYTPEIARLIADWGQGKISWIELGVQSIHNPSLQWMNRQESLADIEGALSLARRYNEKIVAHILLGIPGEKTEHILDTVDYLVSQGVWGFKLHQLQALPRTRLALLERSGRFRHLGIEEYIELVRQILERIPPDRVLHRLVADHNKRTMLRDYKGQEVSKEKALQHIQSYLEEQNSYQGRYLHRNSPTTELPQSL
jgi:radical SAM protein (TIGR01212 family)